MKPTFFGYLCASTLLSSLPLTAENLTPAQALEKYEKSISPDDPKGESQRSLINYLRQAVDDENYSVLERDGYFQGSPTPELTELRSSLLHAKKEKANKEMAEIAILLKDASEAVVKARNPADLDETLSKLSAMKISRSNDPDTQSAQQNVQSANQIVTKWQDYLTEKQAGKREAAESSLRSISGYLSTYPLVPRSKVLLMLSSPLPNAPEEDEVWQPVEEIAAQFQASGNVDAAWAAVQKVPSSKRSGQFAMELGKFVNFKRTAPSMSPEEGMRQLQLAFNNQSPFMSAYQGEVNKLIARDLHTSTTDAAALTTDRYLKSIAKDSIEKEDWDKARWSLDLLSILPSYPRDNSGDTTALAGYLKGQQLEKVGMWAQAIGAYRIGLGGKTALFPPDKIIARMEAMKKEDPKRYEEALLLGEEIDRNDRQRNLAMFQMQYQMDNRGYPGGQKPPGVAQMENTRLDESLSPIVRREIRAILDEQKNAASSGEPRKTEAVPNKEEKK